MDHSDKYKARRFDTPGRCKIFTDIVYQEDTGDSTKLWQQIRDAQRHFDPPAPELQCLVGEMHGHSNFSDGRPDIDAYFQNLRDNAKLDFAALTDHDHGGVGKPPLWAGSPSKWEQIQEAVKKHRVHGSFTTLLGYERDSYPFFNNLIIYSKNDDMEMVRDIRDGEITANRLIEILANPNLLIVPHDTYSFSAGADFIAMDKEFIPPLLEIISRGDPTEYMGNPGFVRDSYCEGGFWQDALKKGAKIGVIAGSDDHLLYNGLVEESYNARYGYPSMYPGVTGLWAKENTLEAIWEALAARRTFAFMLGHPTGAMHGRMAIDFRINNHWMGETIQRNGQDLKIYFNVKSDVPVKTVTLVKNCRNYIVFTVNKELAFDYCQEQDTDYYYLRIELEDGRYGWTSPIWVER